MSVFRIEVAPAMIPADKSVTLQEVSDLRDAGLAGIESGVASRLFFLEGGLSRDDAERIARTLLADPVAETVHVAASDDEIPAPRAGAALEVHLRPGVMDPVAESTLAELRRRGFAVDSVRTARRLTVSGRFDESELISAAARVLGNDCIEEVVPGTAGVPPAPRAPLLPFHLRHVELRQLDDAGLQRLARDGHLFLSLEEMRAVRDYYRRHACDPTDLELETLAQTWSEHCVHKTLKGAFEYRGPGFGRDAERTIEQRYENLLRETIARATDELVRLGRGPECLSVFTDNAGVIAFDDQYGVAFKVETHNHPSAIEPYGGAATGVGGCIRDVLGCGLGARPIANTDVFCVAPSDWPAGELPRGLLHPRRVLRGVVRGVADYGNRMGIPTVNGAIHFDPRYLGNPLVYCGCVGLIPRDRIRKAAHHGDLVVVIGGRTGRDGIHGATFSSAELTESHADEFSHAVQIGNAITEKRVLDAVLRARDAEGGCLFSAITDCGAGGLSSAVGEMGRDTGAVVDLEHVPLKYAGLRYDEIWISEAQERMVLAVPPRSLAAFQSIMRAEEVEATVIGVFGSGPYLREHGDEHDRTRGADPTEPWLIVRYQGTLVGALQMDFLHEGLPKRRATATWAPAITAPRATPARDAAALLSQLADRLRDPTVASKAWVIRQYDHEVQGGAVVRPLCGPGAGPGDAAVLRPRLDSTRGIAVGCGLVPQLFDRDPYWMAVAAIDEAIRNVVCVGGDPGETAILDNFCWGCCDDPQQLGALVRTCQGCHDAALAFGTPFISGKDSLNNEFALHPHDVEPLIATLERIAAQRTWAADWTPALPAIVARIRATQRLSIPGTLLISALSVVADVRRCITADLKSAGAALLLVPGFSPADFDLAAAARTHAAVAGLIARGAARSCHDVSEGGWLTAVAEMALAGGLGVRLDAVDAVDPFELRCAAYVLEVGDADAARAALRDAGAAVVSLGVVAAEPVLRLASASIPVAELRRAWQPG